MNISLAQIAPVRGNIEANIAIHLKAIHEALPHRPDLIIFPELSLTGYEPSLAKDLAIELEDSRLDVFQKLANDHQMTIGIGAPVRSEKGIWISMVLFRSGQARDTYSKQYLHEDELPFFAPGPPSKGMLNDHVALAICYEISVPEHAQIASKNGATIYIASVAKTKQGITSAHETLSQIAKDYSMTVLMCNAVGECEEGLCTGGSAVWDKEGKLKVSFSGVEGVYCVQV